MGKRRTWRKRHLGVDPNRPDGVVAELTTETVTDGEVFPDLMAQLGDQPLGQVSGEGADDQSPCYDVVLERGGTAIIPPRREGVEWGEAHPRTLAVRSCPSEAGRQDWKRRVSYHRRSLRETAL